jgi:hypothetical protein
MLLWVIVLENHKPGHRHLPRMPELPGRGFFISLSNARGTEEHP